MRDDTTHPRSEDLFAYRDGELPPEKRGVIEAHVIGCSACRMLIDQVSSLEAELRRSPDRSPAEYLEHLHESVRARIAAAGGEVETGTVGTEKGVPAGGVRVGRDAGSGRGRRGVFDEDQAGEDRRVRDAPRLPWPAVLSTAGAAAAVLAVVVILVKQGGYPRAPLLPTRVNEAPVGSAPGESGAVGGVARGGRGAGSTAGGKTAGKMGENLAMRDAAKEARAKDRLAKREQKARNEAADQASKVILVPSDEQPMEPEPEQPGRAAALAAPESAEEGRAAASRFRAEESSPTGGEYEAVLRRFGLPPVWDETVSPEALERAEPDLRALYVSGRAGADSARIRLYLAEAMRLRYTPGDYMLYEGIVHHYRRAIALGRSDPEAARVAGARLRTLAR